MNKIRGSSYAAAIDRRARPFRSRIRTRWAPDARLGAPCLPGLELLTEAAPERDGADGLRRLKNSSHHRSSPIRNRRLASLPSAEQSPHVTFSCLCPDIVPFAFERVESSYRFLHLVDVLEVCEGLRKALSKSRGDVHDGLAELIGECANGKRPVEPKIAFVPLVLVGHPQADGRLLGMGLAVGKNASLKHRQSLAAVFERIPREGLNFGRLGTWRIKPYTAPGLPQSVLRETWTSHPQGATDWATVTPIVLDKDVTENAACNTKMDRMIRLACQREGVPEPCEVILTPVSGHFGSPPADAFPCLQQQGSKRPHRHAILIFAEPVRGPLLLGAGRHCGYGLCRPMAGTVDG